jgi:hypothetical protein
LQGETTGLKEVEKLLLLDVSSIQQVGVSIRIDVVSLFNDNLNTMNCNPLV